MADTNTTAEIANQLEDGLVTPNKAASKSSPKKKKNRGRRAFTIEDLFNTLSTQKAYGQSQNLPPRYVLTPRSAESCLHLGIDPEHIKIRDLDSFWEPGLDPARQGMRHEAYCESRHSKMKSLRKERATLSTQAPKHKKGKLTKVQQDLQHRNNAMIEAENRRLEKIQQRQRREIEQLMAFELQMSQIQEENTRKIENDRRREERIKKERLRRQKELQEQRRLKQLKKIAETNLEEKKRRAVAHRLYLREQQVMAEQKRREKIRQQQARAEEMERQRKAEEHRKQTERILQQQQQTILAKLSEMEEHEKIRKAYLERQREEKAKHMMMRRRAIEKRLERNHEALEEQARQRREEFEAKQRLTEERRQRLAEIEEQEREESRQLMILNERKRQMVVEEAKREEELRLQDMLARQEAAEQSLRGVVQQRARQRELMAERKSLNVKQKQENVARQRRIDEYKRLQILRKIQEEEQRTASLLAQKQAVVEERKRAAINIKIQRDQVMKTMDQIKWSKKWGAAKKLTSSLKNSNPNSRSLPSLGSTKKRKGKKGRRKGNRSPGSVGSSGTPRGPSGPAPNRPPRVLAQGSTVEPMPYQSPYEAPQTLDNRRVPKFAESDGSGMVTF